EIWGFPQPRAVLCRDDLRTAYRMKKKATESVKGSSPKSIRAKSLPRPAAGFEPSGRGARPMKVSEDPRFSQAVQNYEAGLRAMQGHKYDKAKSYFEKVA